MAKGKDYLVIGAGEQGAAIASDLLNSDNVGTVGIVDNDSTRLDRIEKRLKDKRLLPITADASGQHMMGDMIPIFDAVIGASTYRHYENLTRLAITAGKHFCDLGGNHYVVQKQFDMAKDAARQGVKVVPDCGIAPGALSILTSYGIGRHGVPRSVNIACGGLPQHPLGIMEYNCPFSVEGLINECKEDAEVIKDGKLVLVKSLDCVEDILFPAPFGMMEKTTTSGGLSTLAKTLEGHVEECSYSTIRYPGHWEKMIAIQSLGGFDEEQMPENLRTPEEITFYMLKKNKVAPNNPAIKVLDALGYFSQKEISCDQGIVTPRKLTEYIFRTNVAYEDQDVLLARVSLEYPDERKLVELNLVDHFDEKKGFSAMQRTTGYSASIIAQMMANGVILDEGVLYQEVSVPAEKFIDEWKKRDINITETVKELEE
ncbi:saccharopine dehydrogenase family protein [Thermoproteota archaeon]